MDAETPCHRRPTRCIFVNILLEILLARNLDLSGLDGQVRTEDSPCDPPAVSAVTEMASSMARE